MSNYKKTCAEIFSGDLDLFRDNGFSRYRGFKDDMDTPTKRGEGGHESSRNATQ